MIRKPILVPQARPFTSEARYLQERRAAILQWAGPRWALHPDNAAARITPAPAPKAYFGER